MLGTFGLYPKNRAVALERSVMLTNVTAVRDSWSTSKCFALPCVPL